MIMIQTNNLKNQQKKDLSRKKNFRSFLLREFFEIAHVVENLFPNYALNALISTVMQKTAQEKEKKF